MAIYKVLWLERVRGRSRVSSEVAGVIGPIWGQRAGRWRMVDEEAYESLRLVVREALHAVATFYPRVGEEIQPLSHQLRVTGRTPSSRRRRGR